MHEVTESPHLETEVLLAHVLGTSRTDLLGHPERTLTPQHYVEYQALVASRATAYPLPYLTNHIEFYGLDFEVTPEVLIPRPETELLVDLALERQPQSIVDIGTGSGCIAIALAVHLPQAFIHAIEISPTALAVTQRNVERHGVEQNVRPIVGDVLSPRPGPVELIVSNPPYVTTSEWTHLPESIRNYEPRQALDGGPDGLAIVRQILAQAPAVLLPQGTILIEIGSGQGPTAVQAARTYFSQAEIRLHRDLAGRHRVLEIQT